MRELKNDIRYKITLDEDQKKVKADIIEKEIVDYEASFFDCISIVDTIQENKLNLIKEIKYEKVDYVGFVSQ